MVQCCLVFFEFWLIAYRKNFGKSGFEQSQGIRKAFARHSQGIRASQEGAKDKVHEEHRMHHVPPLVESPGKNVGKLVYLVYQSCKEL